MSIPVILLKGTVGKLRRLLEDVFDVVEEDGLGEYYTNPNPKLQNKIKRIWK